MAHSTNWKPTDQVLRQTYTVRKHKSQLKMPLALRHFLQPLGPDSRTGSRLEKLHRPQGECPPQH